MLGELITMVSTVQEGLSINNSLLMLSKVISVLSVYYLEMALLYLSRQGLAIRGHDESGLSSNRGNLIELLD